jgi:hypothetical protein
MCQLFGNPTSPGEWSVRVAVPDPLRGTLIPVPVENVAVMVNGAVTVAVGAIGGNTTDPDIWYVNDAEQSKHPPRYVTPSSVASQAN